MGDERDEIVSIIEELISGDIRSAKKVLSEIPTENLIKALEVIEEFGSDIDLEEIKKQAGEI